MAIELLAPAKNKEIAFAALDCGADAVYIGAADFGARKKAFNSLEDIKEIVNYAHKFWAKVYVTLNTILNDDELQKAVDLAISLEKIGIDALIIQDMGLLKKLSEINYSVPLHISTQCDNYLPEKVKFFNDLGVKRVVLARETSLEKIKEIHEENPDLELEHFVHGALCVSFSGQCYLSQYIGGRSANRGECAQPCRKKYSVITQDGKILKENIYALCLKDFNASAQLGALIDAGITSFKIEGRLKDINYVKNIVSFYNQKLKNTERLSSGKSDYPFKPNPEKSFNRGFTEYFLNGREDCFNFNSPKSRGEYLGKVIDIKNNSFKLDTKQEIHNQDGLCFGDDGFLVNKVEKGYIFPNRAIKIKLGAEIYRNLDIQFEKELEKPVKRQIGASLFVENNKIILKDENGIEVVYEFRNIEKANDAEKMKENFIKQFSKTGESDFYITDIEINSEIPFIRVGEINQIRRELFEKLMSKRIEFYNQNLKKKQGKIKYSKFYLDEYDYRANVFNKEAKAFYEKCGCKIIEPALEEKVSNRRIELMRCKHCIKYALNMCKSPIQLALKDDHNNFYPLKFDCKKCEMSVLNQ